MRRLYILFSLLILSFIPSSATASPGHVTLACPGTYPSTGWHSVYGKGGGTTIVLRGQGCMSFHSDGDHVDVTYVGRDGRADGYGIHIYRDLNFVSDGWAHICDTTGSGTFCDGN